MRLLTRATFICLLMLSFNLGAFAQITPGAPVFIRANSPTYGAWMEDPLQTLGAGKIWSMPSFTGTQVLEYSSMAGFQSNTVTVSYNLPSGYQGTGAVVYGGFLYYVKINTNNLVKYNLATQSVVLDVPLSGAGSMNQNHYEWGGYSDIDFSTDQNGLWVLYSGASNAGKLIVSKLNTSTLGVIQTWNTNSEPKTQMGNAFVKDAVVYCVDSYYTNPTTINYSYNTATSTGASISIPINIGTNYMTSMSYNHTTGLLYSWAGGNNYTTSLATPAAALNFDGGNDYVIGSTSSLLNITGDITLETWVKMDGPRADWVRLMGKGDTGNRTYGMWISIGNQILFQGYNAGSSRHDLFSTSALSNGVWYHIAAVRKGSTTAIYINGVLDASGTTSGATSVTADPFTLGYAGYHTYLNGTLDEVRVWNRALCGAEIASNMNCELNPTGQTGLVACYHLNSGFAGSNNAGLTTAVDATTNALNGTLSNFTLNGSTSNWVAPGSISPASVCNAFTLPNLAASSNSPISVGGTLNLTSASGYTTYAWTGPNGFSTNTQNVTVSNVTTGSAGTYTVTGTLNGCTSSSSTTVVVNTPATALHFDGSDDYITAGTSLNPVLDNASALTAEAWIYPTSFTGGAGNSLGCIVGNYWTLNDNMQFLLRKDNNYMVFYVNLGAGFIGISSPANSIVLNTWQHVAGVWDGTTIKLYINGVLQATAAAVGSSLGTHTTNPVLVGTNFFGNGGAPEIFTGKIDEVRLWTRALCQGELISSMNCELGSGQTNLLLNYHLNTGSVNANNAGLTTAVDASGNGYNGTLTNFALNGATSNWSTGSATGTCSAFVVPAITASSNSAVNAGSTINLTSTGSPFTSWSWSGPNGFTSTSQNPSISSASAVHAGVYTVVGTASGCAASATTTVVINSPATALNFDGQNDEITLSGINLANQSFTFECWAKSSAPNTDNVLAGQGPPANNQGLHIGFRSNNVFTFAFYANDLNTSATYTDQDWHHWACVYSTNAGVRSRKIYRDGALVASDVPASDFIGTGTFYVGRHAWGANFNGSIDEVRLWNRALCQSEIQNNMNCELPGGQTGLLVNYKLNQGFVNANNSGVTSATDASGNSNTGTLNNFALNGATSNWTTGNATGICSAFAQPSVTCPANISTNAASGQCTAVVTYSSSSAGTPTPTINYSFSGATTGSGSGNGSGSTFNKGITTVTLTATNTCGAPTCSFTVTVLDNQVPVISCPANISVNATSASGAAVLYTAPVGTDNCPGANTVRTAGLASGATFPIGTTTVTHVVTDASNNTATCSFTVTVSGIAPTISCPSNISVNNTSGLCTGTATYTATATAGIPTPTITYSIASGSVFNLGTTTVMATATNAVGTASCTFTVTVIDNQAPSITCPANISVNNASGQCSASVTVPVPVTSDNCNAIQLPAAPFNSSSSSLMLWLDATQFSTSNGGSLSGVISDASSYSRSLTSNATYETTGFNGRPSMRYNNNQTATTTPFNTNSNTYVYTTIQIVAPSVNWASVFYHWNRDMGLTIEQNGVTSSNVYHFQTNNDNAGVNQTIAFATNYIMAATITGGNVRNFTLYNLRARMLQQSKKGLAMSSVLKPNCDHDGFFDPCPFRCV